MMKYLQGSSPVIQSQGNGYYNYYNISNRHKTEKALVAWYHKDLSQEEIVANNTGIHNKDSENADLYRKLESVYMNVAESNRANYSTVKELYCHLNEKYSATGAYANYSEAQRQSMYINELSMTLFGELGACAGSGQILDDPHLNGEVTKNAPTDTKEFNMKILSQQFRNVFAKNGLDISLFGNARFSFSVNGMTKKICVQLIKDDDKQPVSDSLLEQMEKALNTNDNARQLFYNMLFNANKEGTVSEAERTKYLLYHNFYQETGLDIRQFTQTADGFVNENGEYARDLYKEGLKTSTISAEFKGAAYDYFVSLEQKALRYDISKVPDLTLSMEYQSGIVMLENSEGQFDWKV